MKIFKWIIMCAAINCNIFSTLKHDCNPNKYFIMYKLSTPQHE